MQVFFYLDDFQSDEPEHGEWVCVYSAGVEYEAEILRAKLVDSDIPATILNQSDSMRPFTFGSLAIYKVMVPERYFEEAKNFLKS